MQTEHNKGYSTLRQKAEEKLRASIPYRDPKDLEDDVYRLLHELEVHQIELEMQNQELLEAKEVAETATRKYANLYDIAPSGYFTISKNLLITEVNSYGSNLLGLDRHVLINSRFDAHISNESGKTFIRFIDRVYDNSHNNFCELSTTSDHGIQRNLYITGIIADDNEHILLSVIDVTEKKKIEEVEKVKESLELLFHYYEDKTEGELNYFSNEIQEKVGQGLLALKIDLEMLSRSASVNNETRAMLESIVKDTSEVIKNVQNLGFEILPRMLYDLGLDATIENYCLKFEKRTGIHCKLDIGNVQFPEDKYSLVLFRVFQEILKNIEFHKKSNNIEITLYKAGRTCLLEVIDDGMWSKKDLIYSDTSISAISIREQIRPFAGNLEISNASKDGLRVCIALPLN